jgi:hypothetical protein
LRGNLEAAVVDKEARPMTWLWWAVPLILAVFLWTLNEFLRGSLKEVTSGVLALLMFLLVGVAFFISGWKIGIGALVGALVLVNLLRPLALGLARRLIAYPDLGFEDYSRRQLERTTADLGSDDFFERNEREKEEKARHRTATISSAMKTPKVAKVVSELGAAERDLAALYDRIEVNSLPPRIRETVLHNAQLIRFWLENSGSYDVCDGTYERKVSMGTHLRLYLWTHSSPGGKEPR